MKTMSIQIIPSGGRLEVRVRMRALDQETAERALGLARAAVPAGYDELNANIARGHKAGRPSVSNGKRRHVALVLRMASGGRSMPGPYWRHLMRFAWAASQDQAPSRPSPRTCERPPVSRTTPKS